MRRATVIVCAVALVMVGCQPPSVPPLPAEPDDYDANGVYRDPARSLKTAVIYVYSQTCGVTKGDMTLPRCEAVINAASKEQLFDVYLDILRDPRKPDCVGTVARRATEYPFSSEFRDALRKRRDEFRTQPWQLPSVFDYFVKHGDESDLGWIETMHFDSPDGLVSATAEAVEKLRHRLAVEGK